MSLSWWRAVVSRALLLGTVLGCEAAPPLEPGDEVSFAIVPNGASVTPRDTSRFRALVFVTRASGTDTFDLSPQATWSASAGSVVGGLLTAPLAGAVTVIAAGAYQDTSVADTVNAAVRSASFQLRPGAASINTNDTLRLRAFFYPSASESLATGATWTAFGGGSVSSSGLFTAPSNSGTYPVEGRVSDATATMGDTVSIVVQGPPLPAGEPVPNASSIFLYQENFNSYSSTAALRSGYPARREIFGSINLDGVVAQSGSSFRIDWQDRSTGTCDDSDVLIERAFGGGDAPEWYLRYFVRFDQGYVFRWSGGACSAGVGSKEFLLWRPDNTARITFSVNNQPAIPNIFGTLTDLRWNFSIGAFGGGSIIYRQHLGAEKVPGLVADGQWHRIAMRIRRETAENAGNGVLQVWIDGVQIMDYRGNEAGPAQGQVFTRPSAINVVQYQSVFNAGSPVAQSRWFDEVQFWRQP